MPLECGESVLHLNKYLGEIVANENECTEKGNGKKALKVLTKKGVHVVKNAEVEVVAEREVGNLLEVVESSTTTSAEKENVVEVRREDVGADEVPPSPVDEEGSVEAGVGDGKSYLCSFYIGMGLADKHKRIQSGTNVRLVYNGGHHSSLIDRIVGPDNRNLELIKKIVPTARPFLRRSGFQGPGQRALRPQINLSTTGDAHDFVLAKYIKSFLVIISISKII